jgi:hypothetical protein
MAGQQRIAVVHDRPQVPQFGLVSLATQTVPQEMAGGTQVEVG